MGSCQSFLCAKNNSKRERLLRLDDQIDGQIDGQIDDKIDEAKRNNKVRTMKEGAYFYDMFDPQFSTSQGPPIIPEVGPGK